jgi:hypothetical protein
LKDVNPLGIVSSSYLVIQEENCEKEKIEGLPHYVLNFYYKFSEFQTKAEIKIPTS